MTRTPARKPYSRSAAFFAKAIEFSGKTQREITEEAGFDKPNVISMMKSAEMKIPLDRVPALARACHVDPAHLLRLVLAEHHREVYGVMLDAIGDLLTDNEWEMVACYRLICPDDQVEMDPRVTTEIMDVLLNFRDDIDEEEE